MKWLLATLFLFFLAVPVVADEWPAEVGFLKDTTTLIPPTPCINKTTGEPAFCEARVNIKEGLEYIVIWELDLKTVKEAFVKTLEGWVQIYPRQIPDCRGDDCA